MEHEGCFAVCCSPSESKAHSYRRATVSHCVSLVTHLQHVCPLVPVLSLGCITSVKVTSVLQNKMEEEKKTFKAYSNLLLKIAKPLSRKLLFFFFLLSSDSLLALFLSLPTYYLVLGTQSSLLILLEVFPGEGAELLLFCFSASGIPLRAKKFFRSASAFSEPNSSNFSATCFDDAFAWPCCSPPSLVVFLFNRSFLKMGDCACASQRSQIFKQKKKKKKNRNI